MRLLATKKLTRSFKDRLIQHGFSLIEYPFIKINPLAINFHSINNCLLFTSQNAVEIAFSDNQLRPLLSGKKIFCVGEKTKSKIEEKGEKVQKSAENSAFLVSFLKKNHQNESFSFFCGKRRRPEIEAFFSKSEGRLLVHEIYETQLTPKTFNHSFDGILFFSPSAVESYFQTNSWKSRNHGFCIGPTTASALAPFTTSYSVAKEPTEAQLLLSIQNYYSL